MAQPKSIRNKDQESNKRPRKMTLADKRRIGYQNLADAIFNGAGNLPKR